MPDRRLRRRQTFSVEPKKSAAFTVQFTPPAAGAFSHELALLVRGNPFEQHRLALTGEGVQVRGRPGGCGRAGPAGTGRTRTGGLRGKRADALAPLGAKAPPNRPAFVEIAGKLLAGPGIARASTSMLGLT
jgi:hypothetical protein